MTTNFDLTISMKHSRLLALTCTLIASLPGGASGQVVFHTDRASFDTATSELDLLFDGFESLKVETHFRPRSASVFGGNVTISETETLSFTPNYDVNKIVEVPTFFGNFGIDGAQLSGNYLLGRVQQEVVPLGEQFLSFALDFGGRAHAVGFDLSGAAGGASSPPDGPHHGIEVHTQSGLVQTMQILNDEGFVGVISASNDPITSFRLLDLNTISARGEFFGMDNLVVGVVDAPVIVDPVLTFSSFRIEDPDPAVHLGNSVAAVGDVNGDDIPDYAVSGSIRILDDFQLGIVRVCNGRDGSILHTIPSQFVGAGYAENRNLVGLGDLDGDGLGEIAVGSPSGTNLNPAGFFEIYRANDGSFLRRHLGEGIDQLSYEIAALGDLDGDGVSDYAASNFELGNEGGRVRVYSGASGMELGQVTSGEMVRFYSIAGAGDLNGDGRADLAVTLWSEFEPWNPGEVRVLSGALFGDSANPSGPIDVLSAETQWGILLTLPGRTDIPSFGTESLGLGLQCVGDINGDGVPDLAAGTGPSSDAVIFSGADGTRLHELSSDQFDFSQVVVETEGIGDLDGDGVRDFVVGLVGAIRVISGQDGSVLAERIGGGKLGEEIAAIGDLDGDGISEILAGAPEGGYAELISFSLDRTSLADTPSRLVIRRQGERTTLAWRSGLDATLEKSSNLVGWEPVNDLMFDSLYIVPPTAPGALYYRLRFSP